MALSTSLISYWPLDEASGSAIDAHSTHDLTETSGTIAASSGPGNITGSRDFERGDTELFEVADHADLSTGNIDFTLCAWVNIESKNSGDAAGILQKADADDLEFDLNYNDALNAFQWRVSSGNGFANLTGVTSTSASNGTWYFVVAWHDSVNNVIGISVNNATPVTAGYTHGSYDSAAPFRIGGYSDYNQYWDGLIAGVGFWKRVLTASERRALYNNGSGITYSQLVASPFVRTVTVKSSGGDYTSLAAAEAGEQGDLTSLDWQLDIECYASAAGDSTQVTINGWTTDATRYIRIVCPAGERHAGTWNTGKYYMEGDIGAGGLIFILEDYTRVEYLQIRNTKASPTSDQDGSYAGALHLFYDGCIVRGGHKGIHSAQASSSIFRNCICYGAASSGLHIRANPTLQDQAQNCTLIGALYGLETTAAVQYPLAKNVYAHGGTNAFATDSGAAGGFVTKTNCMSSDTTATNNSGSGGATNCTDSVAHDTANFTNVTGGSEDYRLPSGSALIDAGVDLSGTFTNSVNGVTRAVPFDVGAAAFEAAPSDDYPYPAGAVILPNTILGHHQGTNA